MPMPSFRPTLESLEDRCLLAGGYVQTNLVSNQRGAARMDPTLVDAWGLASTATGPNFVADHGAGAATAYDGNGVPFKILIDIPNAQGKAGMPTGVVYNPTDGFLISKGGKQPVPAAFLFATQDGTIAAWNNFTDPDNAITVINNAAKGAVYTGLTLGTTTRRQPQLYAANFAAGTIDVFDDKFKPVALARGAFTDPKLPAGYAPYDIQIFGDDVYVTYAQQDREKKAPVTGAGKGYVDIYGLDGTFKRRFASGGTLDAPWGLALGPRRLFGQFNEDVLIGNHGDGRINAYDPPTGKFLSQLDDAKGKPLAIDGLYGLKFGNGTANGGSAMALYFTAGPNGGKQGLFGKIVAG